MKGKLKLTAAAGPIVLALIAGGPAPAGATDYVRNVDEGRSGDIILINNGAVTSYPGGLTAIDGTVHLDDGDTVTRTGPGMGDAIELRGEASSLSIVGTTISSSASYTSDADLATLIRAQNGAAVQLTNGTLTSTGAGYTRGLLAADAMIDASGSAISTMGVESDAVHAYGGGIITLEGGTVSTTGNTSHGIYSEKVSVDGVAASITAHDVTISTAGKHSWGAFAEEGGTINLQGGNIDTAGLEAYGILAGLGSHIDVSDTAVSTEGLRSYGLYANSSINADADEAPNGTTASITGTNVTVETQGTETFGAYAKNDGQIDIQGGMITTHGDRAYGLLAGDASLITSSAEIATSGDHAHGVQAGDSLHPTGAAGRIVLQGGKITTSGQDSYALHAIGQGVIEGAVAIQTSGANGFGAFSESGSRITLTGGSITTAGANAIGLLANNDEGTDGGLLQAMDVAVTTTGAGARGGSAEFGGQLALTGGSITTSGTDGHGLLATGAGSDILASGTAVKVSGSQAYGVSATDDGAITLTGGSVAAASRALSANGGSITGTDAVLSNTVLAGNSAETGVAYAVRGGSITLTGGSATASGGRNNGLFAVTGGTIDATNVAIVATGDRSRGAYASASNSGAGAIALSGGSIQTDGALAHGLFAKRESGATENMIATVTASDVAILVDGADSNGVYADIGSSITLNGGTINTAGERGIGLHAQANDDGWTGDATISATNVAVNTTGANALGGYAELGGQLMLDGGSVRTSGAGAHGLVASGPGSSLARMPAPSLSIVIANNLDVRTTGENAAGLAVLGSGQMQLTGGSVDSAGPVIFAATASGTTADIAIAGSRLTSRNGVLLGVDRSADGEGMGVVMLNLSDGASAVGYIRDTGFKTSGYTDVALDGANFEGGVDGVRTLALDGAAVWRATGARAIGEVKIGAGGATIETLADKILLDGRLTGSGDVVKAGSGQLVLSGDGTGYTGTATIDAGKILLTGSLAGDVVINEAGTLQIGNGDASGDLTGATRNDGKLIFARSDDYDYIGALSGDGALIKQGDGTLLLSGAYSYTGSTKIEGGLIKLASALDSGTDLIVDGGTFDLSDKTQEVAGLSGTSGGVALGGSGALTVNQANDTDFGGSISGQGSFTKTGSGSLNLTGDSSFTGQVAVDGGRLAVNGTLPGDVNVNSGGTLGGNGQIGSARVSEGGMVAPGNSIGTLHVTDDVTFDAGSVYAVEVDANGNSDRIEATGAANIDGGTVSVRTAAGNYRWSTDYVILTADGGVNGTFAATDVDLPFLTPSLDYGANDVTLTLTRNDRSFGSTAATRNQRAVAVALDASAQTSNLYRAVAGQADISGALQAFDALSGELWATTGTFLIDQSRRAGELVLGRMQQADTISRALSSAGSAATQTRDGRIAIWGQGIGSWNKVKGNGNAARATQDQFGFITGLDMGLGDWRIGAAFSHGEGKVAVDGRDSRATIDGSTAAAYIGGGWGALRVRLGASYGWYDIAGQRTVSFAGLSEELSGDHESRTASVFSEISYAARIGKATIEPFAGVNHVHLKNDGFIETGGSAVLGVQDVKRDVTFTTLGLRLGTDIAASDRAVLTPRISVAWQHGFGDVAAKGGNLLPTGQSFTIEGLPATRNALLLEAGAQVSIMPGGSLGLSYVGNIADRWTDHGIKLGFSYSF